MVIARKSLLILMILLGVVLLAGYLYYIKIYKPQQIFVGVPVTASGIVLRGGGVGDVKIYCPNEMYLKDNDSHAFWLIDPKVAPEERPRAFDYYENKIIDVYGKTGEGKNDCKKTSPCECNDFIVVERINVVSKN